MGLTIIAGPANSGKTGALLQRLRERAGSGTPVLVVPQAPDADRARQVLARMSVSGIKAIPIDTWIDELWRSHGDGRRVVSASQRAALMDEALSSTVLTGEMAESAKSSGFLRLACAVAARAIVVDDGLYAGVEGQMRRLLDTYHELLAERALIERSHAALVLASWSPDVGGPVAVNHFTDLSPHQEALLLGLARTQEVLIALTWEEGRAATESLSPLVERLFRTGAHLVRLEGEAGRTDAGLVELAERLYEGRPAVPCPGALRLIEAEGTDAELEAVAEAVREALEEGFRPGRVAVAVRAVEEIALPLAELLEAEGVPVTLDVALAFPTTSFGRALLSLLGAARRAGSREALLAYLLSPYSEAHGDEVAELDEEWRRRRAGDDLVRGAAVRFPQDRALRTVRALVDGDGTGTAEQWKILADSLRRASARQRHGSELSALLDSRCHGVVLSVISELAEGELPLTVDRVIDALRTAVVPTGVPAGDRVLVTEAHRLRGRRFDVVVIAGLDADRFAPAAEAPLVERICASLGRSAIRDMAAAERLLFYLLVTRASRRLVLSRRVADDSGRDVAPSPLLEELLDVYRTPAQAAEGAHPAGLSVRRAVAGEGGPLRGGGAAGSRAKRYAPARLESGARGLLRDENVLAALAGREEFSASEIELYLSCPYRWFVRFMLAPREIDQELDARASGVAVHGLLALFYERWRREGRGRVTTANLEEALQVLERIAEDSAMPWLYRADEAAAGIIARRVRAEARAVIADDARFLPGFSPQGHEVRFGRDRDAPVTVGDVPLKGSIDRIDAAEDGVVVIDYKSVAGRDLAGVRGLAKNGLVQLPVYAVAAHLLTGAPVVAAVYRSTRSLACRGFWLDGALDAGVRFSDQDRVDASGLRAVIEQAEELIARAAEGIRAGRIPREPRTPSQCDRCEAAPICGGSS